MTISQTDVDSLFSGGAGAEPSQTDTADQGTAPVGQATPPRVEPGASEIRRVLGLSVPVSVTVADREMSVTAILAIQVGTIIEFEASFDTELVLNVANQPIGQGHAVKFGENFGLRVTQIDSVEERIGALGGGGESH